MLKERNDRLERSTEERAQKEEEIVKLNEQISKLDERVASLLASKEHAETEFMSVEKSMLEERDELLAHSSIDLSTFNNSVSACSLLASKVETLSSNLMIFSLSFIISSSF